MLKNRWRLFQDLLEFRRSIENTSLQSHLQKPSGFTLIPFWKAIKE
jgi:hypothetical protein